MPYQQRLLLSKVGRWVSSFLAGSEFRGKKVSTLHNIWRNSLYGNTLQQLMKPYQCPTRLISFDGTCQNASNLLKLAQHMNVHNSLAASQEWKLFLIVNFIVSFQLFFIQNNVTIQWSLGHSLAVGRWWLKIRIFGSAALGNKEAFGTKVPKKMWQF